MYRLSLALLVLSTACRGTPTDAASTCEDGPVETWRENVVPAYEDPDNVGELTFSVVDGELVLSAPDLQTYGIDYEPDLLAISSTSYTMTLDDVGMLSTFIDDDDGNPRWLRTRFFVAERVD